MVRPTALAAIEFDPESDPVDAEFLAHLARLGGADGADGAAEVKDMLLMGFFCVTRGVCARLRQQERVEAVEVEALGTTPEAAAAAAAADVRRELEAALRAQEDAVARAREDAAQRLVLQEGAWRARGEAERERALLAAEKEHLGRQQQTLLELEKYRALWSALREQREGERALVAAHETEVRRLQAELDVLRRSNAGKGALGELLLQGWFRGAFPAWEVNDTSRTAAACDMQVRVSAREFFVVESKNKATVERGDVDKFVRDVARLAATHGAAFLGGLFVSVRSRSIPGRGAFGLEFVANRPVIFLGFAAEDGLQDELLRASVDSLRQVAGHVARLAEGHDAAAALSQLRARLAPLVREVGAARDLIDGIKGHCAEAVKRCDALFARVSGVFEEMSRQAAAAAAPVAAPGGGEEEEAGEDGEGCACPACGRVFAAARGLAAHRRHCRSG